MPPISVGFLYVKKSYPNSSPETGCCIAVDPALREWAGVKHGDEGYFKYKQYNSQYQLSLGDPVRKINSHLKHWNDGEMLVTSCQC